MSYARVIVEVEPYHLDRPFDYAVPDDLRDEVQVGSRVEVVFAGRKRRGVVTALTDTTEVEPGRIQPLRRVFGPHAWLREDELDVARWAATRFGGPVADVVRHALPNRTVDVERRAERAGWFPPGAAPRPRSDPAPDASALAAGWAPYGDGGRRLLESAADGSGAFLWRPLADEDLAARLAEVVQVTLAGDRDVLVVVPDPSSPVADAVVNAAGDLAVDARGGPSARRTYGLWLQARCGYARVVVGERGVVMWPLERLGLAIVLDEANPALKERRSPRHHAREVALERARRADGVGLLVSRVPSAPAWRLLAERRLEPVIPDRETERRRAPLVEVVTGEGRPRTRISREGMDALRRATRDGAYGVVLASRRGEGRALACSSCGERLRCPTCSSSVAPVPGRRQVHCEGCGWRSTRVVRCERCRGERFAPLAAGAERVGAELARAFGDTPVAVLEGYAAEPPPPPAVLVMTRGSVLDAPPGPVGAVVLPDIDGMLRRPTLDAAEDALRLAVQLASWTAATRRERDGDGAAASRDPAARVVVQTREPDHPAVQALVAWDVGAFWRSEAALRAELAFPPAAYALRLSVPADRADEVADAVVDAVPPGDQVLGPLPRDDRATLLVKCRDRVATLAAIDAPRRVWSKAGADVRVDVDPVDAGP